MATKVAGPLLATGALTWANQVIFAPEPPDNLFETSARIGIATGMLIGGFYIMEQFSEELAVGLAWVAFATTILVRMNNRPTPLERALDLLE